MADPIIQAPTPTIITASGQSAADQIISEADAMRESMINEAQEFFDGQGRVEPKAAAPPKSTPKSQATPQPAPQPAPPPVQKGKLPGAPQLAQAPQQPHPTSATEDDPDLPREYKAGSIRAEQWNKMHASRDSLKTQLTELQRQYQEAVTKIKASSPGEDITSQLAALRAERDDYQKRLESVAVERSPRFEAQFKPRLDAAMSLAKSVVGPEQATRIEQILSMPDSVYRNAELRAIAQNLVDDPLSLSQFGNAVAEVNRISMERQNAAAKSSELFKQWTSEEQQRAEQSRQATTQQAQSKFDSEFSQWQSLEFFKAKPGDEAHNAAVNNRISLAREIYNGGLPMEEVARASIWAAIGPDLAAQLTALQAENAALKAEGSSLRGSQPSIAPDSGDSGDEAPINPNLSYADSIAASIVREGLLR